MNAPYATVWQGACGNHPAQAVPFSTAALLAELDESESAAAESSWTVGYLDVLLLMLTLLAVLLGVTYMQVGETDPQPPHQVELALELPVAAAPPQLDPGVLLAVYQSRPAAPPPAAATPKVETAEPKTEPVPLPKKPQPAPVVTVAASAPAAPPAQPGLPPALRRLADLVAGDAGDLLDLLVGDRELRLELRDDILFPLGSAQMGDRGRALLTRLAGELAEQETEIVIEGHTDDLPIATPRFPSNWELSTFRATTVARFLIDQGVPARLLRATGYADNRPRVPNDSAGHRSLNRRVSIVLRLPALETPETPEPSAGLPSHPAWREL